VAILRSLPGIGRINLATLLAEASGPVSRRDYSALRTLTGVAPVTKRSGKMCVVMMRSAAHGRLRDAVYHWARVAVQRDPASGDRYAALRKRGCSHGRALRGVADRLLRA
jgi:transposase